MNERILFKSVEVTSVPLILGENTAPFNYFLFLCFFDIMKQRNKDRSE
ncbi:hypothetical protein SAMN05421668_11068 [Halolactibacillus miurensis]|uniref:Uncharacterized protein n=1 Tax=Halolactibacillus miurensis TaxID=306541 RepID=A0A1I6ST18_9BACI|nr:hypothetical protein SAMN05421668_11068 [Halolactibacillus miurensis]